MKKKVDTRKSVDTPKGAEAEKKSLSAKLGGLFNSKYKFLTIFVCIFLAFVIILGTTLGIIIGVRNARTYARYGSTYVDEGTVNFLASIYKTEYIAELSSAGVRAYDSKYFWIDKAEDGETYGEKLNAGFREYLSGLLVAAELYGSYAKYTKADKRAVRTAAEQVMQYAGGGTKESFHEKAEKYGFDYDDFLAGCELLYKASRAKIAIYGEDGANLAYYADECEKYLAQYTHVSLLFVRTEETFLLDSDGNPVTEDGEYVMRPLTDEELAERNDTIAKLRAAIKAGEDGEDGAISPEMFDIYLKKSDGDKEMLEKGYYFIPAASETAAFASYHPTIVDKAYEMEIGEYAEVECSVGICFIYKYEPLKGAYADKDNQFFSDFYSDASVYLYALSLSQLAFEVVFSEKLDAVDVSLIPKNSELTVNGF